MEISIKSKKYLSIAMMIVLLMSLTSCTANTDKNTYQSDNLETELMESITDSIATEVGDEEHTNEWMPISHEMSPSAKPITLKEEGFSLVKEGVAATIYVEDQDYKGVHIAASNLVNDITLVTDITPQLINATDEMGRYVVIAGTIENNSVIKSLIQNKKIDVTAIDGLWESYIIQVVKEPMEGVEEALVIAGSDKRGAIYGIYQISEAIGVSPWVWWADSTPVKQKELVLSIEKDRFVQGEPSVKYRGIFLNNENPSLLNWVNKNYGNFNSKFYSQVFELILRLKGNYLWPAMWGKAFNTDDQVNPQVADDYGIVMGTSHHEPMMRAQKEWTANKKQYGDEWNYYTNKKGLYSFWEDRIITNAEYDKLITVGMRGDGDMPMIAGGSVQQHIDLLEEIVADQREIIGKYIDKDVTKVPQVWTLYKEVEDYYKAGMEVPEDIILMLTNDNFGNVRTLPTDKDRDRLGGFGMYYHFDYVGGPRSYKWLNTVPLTKIWEQMTMAYDYGVDKIWIVNVGDLKPMELPIDYFLNLAYDFDKWSQLNKVEQFTYDWACREFGETYAYEIAKILNGYTKLNGMRKPEILTPDTYSVTNYGEAKRILEESEALTGLAERIYSNLPKEKLDAFYQLVLYPTKASMLVLRMQIYAGLNYLYAEQGRAIANTYADLVQKQYYLDMTETRVYNKTLANGKWDGMMSQAHMNQTQWQAPEKNVVTPTKTIPINKGSELIVGVQNTREAYRTGTVTLEDFTDINNEVVTIEIANGKDTPFDYTITPSEEFILVSEQGGTVELQNSFTISIDYTKIPTALMEAKGTVTVNGAGKEVVLKINAKKIDIQNLPKMTFVETHGYISIEAEHFAKNVPMEGGEWAVIHQYGRTLSSVKVLPNRLSPRVPKEDAPYLEYNIYVSQPGEYEITTYVAPTNNLSAETGMSYAIGVDEEMPVYVDTFPNNWYVGDRGHQWSQGVMDNIHINQTTHMIMEPGLHKVRFYMVDAGLVLQKIVIDTNQSVLPSYLGPEESFYVK